jgi:hypothetical protein
VTASEMSQSELAVVLGSTGGIGSALVEAIERSGISERLSGSHVVTAYMWTWKTKIQLQMLQPKWPAEVRSVWRSMQWGFYTLTSCSLRRAGEA